MLVDQTTPLAFLGLDGIEIGARYTSAEDAERDVSAKLSLSPFAAPPHYFELTSRCSAYLKLHPVTLKLSSFKSATLLKIPSVKLWPNGVANLGLLATPFG